MKYKNILITGGAGFIGSNLAHKLKSDYPKAEITCLDNLMRRGSELNLPTLQEMGITFIHGDIRNKEDLEIKADLIIECSAEPSVLSGLTGNPNYVINTNLVGAINCLELARQNKADFIFLSTSRVYPYDKLDKLKFKETKTRFELDDNQEIEGASRLGISEDFPLDGPRSFYGATKLSAELFIKEYQEAYKIKTIINRFGVITGPGQMGKVDQGVIVFWLARHLFNGRLSYIGYGGKGKQVRDFLHIDDLYSALKIQLNDINKYNGKIYNIGGGVKNSLSLLELTSLCQKITGNKIPVSSEQINRPADVRIYITDSSKFIAESGWQIKNDGSKTLRDIYSWMKKKKNELKGIFN